MARDWQVPQQQPKPADDTVRQRTLVVGREISLSGTISSCDRLVVDGKVDATLVDCGHLAVSETGRFGGSVEIATAEIAGSYEGKLAVRGNLLIRSTGRVSGTTVCGDIEIELGGRISGSVATTKMPVAEAPRERSAR